MADQFKNVSKPPKLGKFDPNAKKPATPKVSVQKKAKLLQAKNLGKPPFTPSAHAQKLINEQIAKLVGEVPGLGGTPDPDPEKVEWEYYCWAAPMPDQDITCLYLVRHGFWEDAPVSQYARIISTTKQLVWSWYVGTQKIIPLISFHWAQMQKLTEAQAKKLTKALGGMHQKPPVPVEDDEDLALLKDDEFPDDQLLVGEPGGWAEGTAFVPMGITEKGEMVWGEKDPEAYLNQANYDFSDDEEA